MSLGIVILNYRTPEMSLDCLRSLAGEVGGVDARAVVVDNASGDDSADRIERAIAAHGWEGWARVVRNPINGGFAQGNNLGVRQQDADAFLLLNSDTLLRPGALGGLIASLGRHPEAGVIAPRLEWPDGTPQGSAFRWINPVSELIRAAGTGPITRCLSRFDVPLPVSDAPMEAPWVSFAACLIHRKAYEKLGGMDEGFFMYYEDVDFCRRVWGAGMKVVCDPTARVVHLRGGSSPVKRQEADRARRDRYYYASRSRYFGKHYGRTGLWLANAMWTCGHAVATLRELLGKRPHACRHEWRDIWTNALSPLR